MLVFLSAAAVAGPNFDWIEARQVGRRLTVDYARSRGPVFGDPTVRLVVNTRNGRFTMRADAGPRRGQWTFDRLPPGVDEVQIRCPDTCAIRDLEVGSFSLRVDRSEADRPRGGRRGRPGEVVRPPPPPDWGIDRSVIEACERTFVSDRDELQCLEVARRYPVHPGPAIRACGQAFVGSADELRCVAAASAAPLNASPAIDACARAFTSSRDELACVERTVGDPVVSPPVVDACARAFVGSDAELACIDLGLTRPRRAPEIVQACDRSFVGERQQLECIRTSLPR